MLSRGLSQREAAQIRAQTARAMPQPMAPADARPQTTQPRFWENQYAMKNGVLALVVGAALGVALALGAAASLSRIDANLICLIPSAAATGLTALLAIDMLHTRR
jgi:hypothetical protein